MEGRVMNRTHVRRSGWSPLLAGLAGLCVAASAATAADAFHVSGITNPTEHDQSVRPDGWDWTDATPGGPKDVGDNTPDYRSHSDVPDLPDSGDDPGASAPVDASWVIPDDPFAQPILPRGTRVASDTTSRTIAVGPSGSVGVVPTPGAVLGLAMGLGVAGARRRRR
jgi:hypothetical protein